MRIPHSAAERSTTSVPRFRRPLRPLAAVALAALALMPTTSVRAEGWNEIWAGDAEYGWPGPYSRACDDLVDGTTSVPTAAPTITKTVGRFDKPNGNTVVTVDLVGPFPDGDRTTIFDCVWIDRDGNGRVDDGDHIRPYLRMAAPISGVGSERSIRFYALLGTSGAQVCNRAFGVDFMAMSDARTAVEAGGTPEAVAPWATWSTATVCSSVVPPAEIPDVPSGALLLLTLGATGIGATWLLRRRVPATIA
jgi:hypothetical protein